MLRPEWLTRTGQLDYEKYLDSPEWRRFRDAYWRRHRDARCARCGITSRAHRATFGARLTLRHLTYEVIGQEIDEDFEVLCQRCYLTTHTGAVGAPEIVLSEAVLAARIEDPDFWEKTIERIGHKRATLVARYPADDPELWRHLQRLVWLEQYARDCRVREAMETT